MPTDDLTPRLALPVRYRCKVTAPFASLHMIIAFCAKNDLLQALTQTFGWDSRECACLSGWVSTRDEQASVNRFEERERLQPALLYESSRSKLST